MASGTGGDWKPRPAEGIPFARTGGSNIGSDLRPPVSPLLRFPRIGRVAGSGKTLFLFLFALRIGETVSYEHDEKSDNSHRDSQPPKRGSDRKTYRSGNPDRRRGFDPSDIVAALKNDGPSQKTDSGKKPLKGAAN